MASRVSKRLQVILETKNVGAGAQEKFIAKLGKTKQAYEALQKELKTNANLTETEKTKMEALSSAMVKHGQNLKKASQAEAKRIAEAKKAIKIFDKLTAAQQKLASGKGLGAGGRAGFLKTVIQPLRKELNKTAAVYNELERTTNRYTRAAQRSEKELKKLAGQENRTANSQNKRSSANNKEARSQQKVNTELNKTNDTMKKGGQRIKTMEGTFRRKLGSIRNQILVVTFAFGAFVRVLKSAFDEARRTEAALTGLSSVAMNMGIAMGDANNAAIQLSSDGLLTVQEASAGLKNLLAAGLGLPESIELMRVFKNSAAFNRQGTLELGEAVVGATQGVKNMNSIMVDNAGITKNLSVMYKEFAAQIGTTEGKLTDAQKVQAAYNGIVKEGAIFNGDAERALDTVEGKMILLNAAVRQSKIEFGDAMMPAMKAVLDVLQGMIKGFTEYVTTNKELIKQNLAQWGKNIATVLKTVATVAAVLGPIFAVLTGVTGKFFLSFGAAFLVLRTLKKMSLSTKMVAKDMKGLAFSTKAGANAWKLYSADGKRAYGTMSFLSMGLAGNALGLKKVANLFLFKIGAMKRATAAMIANGNATVFTNAKLKLLTVTQNFFIKQSKIASKQMIALKGGLTGVARAAAVARVAIIGVKIALYSLAAQTVVLLAIMLVFEALFWIWQAVSDWWYRDSYIAEGMNEVAAAAARVEMTNMQTAASFSIVSRAADQYGVSTKAATEKLVALESYQMRILALEKEAREIRNEDDIDKVKGMIQQVEEKYDEELNKFKEMQTQIEQKTAEHEQRMQTMRKSFQDSSTKMYESTESSRVRKLKGVLIEMTNAYRDFFDNVSEEHVKESWYLQGMQQFYQERRLTIEKEINRQILDERRRLKQRMAKEEATLVRSQGSSFIEGRALEEFKLEDHYTKALERHNDAVEAANAKMLEFQNRAELLAQDINMAWLSMGDNAYKMVDKMNDAQTKWENVFAGFSTIQEVDWDKTQFSNFEQFNQAVVKDIGKVTKHIRGANDGLIKFFQDGFTNQTLTLDNFNEHLRGDFIPGMEDAEAALSHIQQRIDKTSDAELRTFYVNLKSALMDYVNESEKVPDFLKGIIAEHGDYLQSQEQLGEELRNHIKTQNENIDGLKRQIELTGQWVGISKQLLVLEENFRDVREINQQQAKIDNTALDYANKFYAAEHKVKENYFKQVEKLQQRNEKIKATIKLENVSIELLKEQDMYTDTIKQNKEDIIEGLKAETKYNEERIKQLEKYETQESLLVKLEQTHLETVYQLGLEYDRQLEGLQQAVEFKQQFVEMIGDQEYSAIVRANAEAGKMTLEYQKQKNILAGHVNFTNVLSGLVKDPALKVALQQQATYYGEQFQHMDKIYKKNLENLETMKEVQVQIAKINADLKYEQSITAESNARWDHKAQTLSVIAGLQKDQSAYLRQNLSMQAEGLKRQAEAKNEILDADIEILKIIRNQNLHDDKMKDSINKQIKLKNDEKAINDKIYKQQKKTLKFQHDIKEMQNNVNMMQKDAQMGSERKLAKLEKEYTLYTSLAKAYKAERTAAKYAYKQQRKVATIQYNLKIKEVKLEMLYLEIFIEKLKLKGKEYRLHVQLLEAKMLELKLDKLHLESLKSLKLDTLKIDYENNLLLIKNNEALQEYVKLKQHAVKLSEAEQSLETTHISDETKKASGFGKRFASFGDFDIYQDLMKGLGIYTKAAEKKFKDFLKLRETEFKAHATKELEQAKAMKATTADEKKIKKDIVAEKTAELAKVDEQWQKEQKLLEIEESRLLIQKKYNALLTATRFITDAISGSLNRQIESQREEANEEHRLNEQRRLGVIDQATFEKRAEHNRKKYAAQRKLDEAQAHHDMVKNAMEMIGLELIKGGIMRLVDPWVGNDAKGYALLAAGAALSALGGTIANEVFGSQIQEAEQELITLDEELAAWEAAQGGTDEGGARSGRRSFGGTVRAEQLTVNITPTMIITGEQVFIGSGSVQEFSDVIAANMIGNIQQSIESGELDFSQVANSADNTTTTGG